MLQFHGQGTLLEGSLDQEPLPPDSGEGFNVQGVGDSASQTQSSSGGDNVDSKLARTPTVDPKVRWRRRLKNVAIIFFCFAISYLNPWVTFV